MPLFDKRKIREIISINLTFVIMLRKYMEV